MTYAIVQLGGKQYRVAEGEEIVVDRVAEELRSDSSITLKDVLLVSTDGTVKIGTPFVDGAAVTLKVVSDDKGEKLRIFKYKAKSRYRRTMGHRQLNTTLQVTSIAA